MAKKEFKFTKDAVNVVIGINISLCAVIILVSNWVSWLSFLAKGIAFVVGFVGFWVLIPYLFLLGLFIALRKTLIKFKMGVTMGGIFLIIFAVGLLTSHFATLPLYITKETEDGLRIVSNANEPLPWLTSIETFKAVFAKAFNTENAKLYTIDNSIVEGGVSSSVLGGGFFCYIFLGLFNSISGGKATITIVLSVILIVLGVFLISLRLIQKLIRNAKEKKNKQEPYVPENISQEPVIESQSVSREPVVSEPAQYDYRQYQIHDEPVQESVSTVPNPDEILARSMESFNNQHTMQKAMFSFDSDEQTEVNHLLDDNGNDLVNPYANNEQPREQNISIIQSNVSRETTNPYYDFENDDQVTEPEQIFAQQVASEPVYQEPVYQEPAFQQPVKEEPADNTLNNIFNPGYQEEPVQPQVQPKPVIQPTVVQTVSSQPTPQPEPEQPKKRVLHWDDDDDIVVDIPKAFPRGPYEFPPISLLEPHEKPEDAAANNDSCQDQITMLEGIFSELKVGATIVGYTIGPSVTQFEIKMNDGVSVKIFDRVLNDISIRMGGVPVIFTPVVLGRPTSGLQIPNKIRTNVGLYESLMTYPAPTGEDCDTTVPFGKDINGKIISMKVADAPHMLVAGTTGSGKSVFIHNIILSLIMRNRPEDLKIVLIDPKGVEMTFYKKIPHLICPMIVDASKASVALGKLVDEMENRNKIFNSACVRDIKEFNKIAPQMGYAKMPSIVVFVDEYADLSEQCKDIEGKIQRIGQKARTAGIHLVIATQRPSVNIISGVIKANLPTHVALSVGSVEDSRTILGEMGAESLLGNGDMLVDAPKLCRNQKIRVQSAFADTKEINMVANFLRSHYQPMYWDEYNDLTDHTNDVSVPETMGGTATQLEKNATDNELYLHIKSEVMQRSHCSISYIQRSYAVGFPKAGKIFARLQEEGVVDRVPESAAKGCKVLMHVAQNNEDQGAGSVDQSEIVRDFDPTVGY